MKRILSTMCALTLILAAAVPALAVEPEQSASYYPTSVEEYMEGDSPRIKKVYQLSLADDPSKIPTEDFERDGRLYYLLDMTRKDEVGVDIQTITQTKTLASETNDMEQILQSLEPQMEVTTEDGYPDGTPIEPLMPLRDRPLPSPRDDLHPGYPNFVEGTFGEEPLQPPLGVLTPGGQPTHKATLRS